MLALIPLAGLTVFLLIKALPGDQTGRDFRQLYAAGYMLRTGQASQLYDIKVQRAVQHELFSSGAGDYIYFLRPAYEAILLAPFSLLPYRSAYYCFLALNAVLVAVTIVMLSPELGWTTVYVSAIVLCFMPVSIALFAGQDSILLTVILTASCKALDRDRPLTAGIIAGLAMFKFQLMIPIFLLFLVWRYWKFCCGFILSAVGLGIVSISIVGIHQFDSYFRLLHEVDRNKALAVHLMGNLHGLLVGAFGNVPPKAVIAADVSLAGLLAIFLPRLQEGRDALLLAIPAAVICSYYLFSHDLTVLLLPIIGVTIARQTTNLLWCSALLLVLAPTAMMSRPYLMALLLTFFLLELAQAHRRAGGSVRASAVS